MKTRKDKRELLDKIQMLERCLTKSTTILPDELKAYTDEYLMLYVKVCTGKVCVEEALSLRNALVTAMFNVFNPRDNRNHRIEKVEKIADVVMDCEQDFSSDLRIAWSFFGDSFGNKRMLEFPQITQSNSLPNTVTAMKDDPKRQSWIEHIIKKGYPIPMYLELYRSALPRIINEYLKEYESKAMEVVKKDN